MNYFYIMLYKYKQIGKLIKANHMGHRSVSGVKALAMEAVEQISTPGAYMKVGENQLHKVVL